MGKVLIVADLNEKCSATPRGLALAAKFNFSVELVAFVYQPLHRMNLSAAQKAETKKRLIEERRAVVQTRLDRLIKPGQKVTLKVVWEKDVGDWVNKHCSKSFEAVVKTRHGTETLFYTSTDWQILRECQSPVLVVAEKRWHKTKPVLAALDLASRSKHKKQLNRLVLEKAKALADAVGSELKIINAIDVPTLLADLDIIDSNRYVKEQKALMEPHIKELAKAFELPISAFRCKRGPAPKVIISQAAKLRAQVVVIGTVGRRGVRARLLGNTAESILEHLHTDVLAVKSS